MDRLQKCQKIRNAVIGQKTTDQEVPIHVVFVHLLHRQSQSLHCAGMSSMLPNLLDSNTAITTSGSIVVDRPNDVPCHYCLPLFGRVVLKTSVLSLPCRIVYLLNVVYLSHQCQTLGRPGSTCPKSCGLSENWSASLNEMTFNVLKRCLFRLIITFLF